ncbi:WW domain-containing adapter protein with coiled-coil-like isoform X4 [Oryzias latipes]|uniref:WW domain-containing adapter protein with coiled-coil-like isoform X4 n=1 Tax=Oryzias latipes TaxID=8090 RepID=UPI0009D99A44|nr:WW domain-containing adapter protein with coiled-coil-like isoform X4 [Oryzias latipes]
MQGNQQESAMGSTTEGIHNPIRPSNPGQRASLSKNDLITQAHKSQPKSQSGSLYRYDKVRDGLSDPIPPYKVLRRSDESPVSRHGDNAGHSKARVSHSVRGKNGTSGSPQEASHNNSAQHGADPHAAQSKPADRDPADDWTEHISSSGKKYYYNCRTEVSQWEKPKDLLEREQRQKDTTKMATNSFPKDMDYRQEALQDKAASKPTAGEQSTPSSSSHSSSSSSSSAQSLNSAAALGSAPSNTSSSSSSSSSSASGQASASVLSSALLQDPALLHQLLPALQATLQMNNGSMDVAKLNEAQHSSPSPVSLATDSSSPRPYLSPRNGVPQNTQKPPLGMHAASITSTQTRGSMSSGKQGAAPFSQTTEKRPEDPRTLQQRSSQELLCTGSSVSSGSLPLAASSSHTQLEAPGSFTPSLAAHFDDNLIKHIQGWPSENTEKQAARLREDFYNMGSLYMSEICTEMKNLRSLVRVCEIQATLREQRILFLRQQIKELDKLKNQNSYMV